MERSVAQEVARRGKEIYEREIRAEVEPEQEGRFLVVDVNSGSYALADDALEAFDRAQAITPEGTLYLIRVGRRAAHRVGVTAVGPTSLRGAVRRRLEGPSRVVEVSPRSISP
jgi:hypothetical protein